LKKGGPDGGDGGRGGHVFFLGNKDFGLFHLKLLDISKREAVVMEVVTEVQERMVKISLLKCH
jgi:GTPase involved in cell partitioning and DNA repair